MSDNRQINFTIMPDEKGTEPRIYANFCAVAHTPFDFTLTFCEVMPLSEKDLRAAETERVVRAPVRVKIVVPTTLSFGPRCGAAGAVAGAERGAAQPRLAKGSRALVFRLMPDRSTPTPCSWFETRHRRGPVGISSKPSVVGWLRRGQGHPAHRAFS